MKRWYVYREQPACGNLAADNLRAQDFESLVIQTRDGVGKLSGAPRYSPLLPGYGFVRFDIGRDHWQWIRGTRGVIDLLPARVEIPRPVPVGIVEELSGKVANGDFDEDRIGDVLARITRGQIVRVVAGGFEGLTGTFIRRNKGALIVLMSLFKTEHELSFQPHQVEPVFAKVA